MIFEARVKGGVYIVVAEDMVSAAKKLGTHISEIFSLSVAVEIKEIIQ